MATERNFVLLYKSQHTLFGDINQSQNLKIYMKVKAAIKDPLLQKMMDDREWWFYILRRSSILSRSSKGNATSSSPISSIGIVGTFGKAHADVSFARKGNGPWELRELWEGSGKWSKGGMQILSIIHKDSKFSGVIAHRAIDLNHFLDAKMEDDAKMRAQTKAPANPSLITGSWEDFSGIDYEEVASDAKTRFSTHNLDERYKKQASCINF